MLSHPVKISLNVFSIKQAVDPLIKSNFEVNEDSELTTRGFITMHEAQLQQEGEEEIRKSEKERREKQEVGYPFESER